MPSPTPTKPRAEEALPPSGGSYIRQPDGTLVPNAPATDLPTAAPAATTPDHTDFQE